MKERISLEDNLMTIIMKMSGGNPGAVTALVELYQRADAIDPDNALGGLGQLLMLDTFGIYEENIWMLYKDLCGGDPSKVITLLRACQLGKLSERDLHTAITGGDRGYGSAELLPKTFPEYLIEVRKVCSRFANGVQY